MSQQCHHLFRVSQTVSDLPILKRASNGLRKRGDLLKVTKQTATMKHHTLVYQDYNHVNTDTWHCHPKCVHTQQRVTPTVTAPQATADALTHGKGRLGVVWPEVGHPTWRRATTKLPCHIAAPSLWGRQQAVPVSLQPMAAVSPMSDPGAAVENCPQDWGAPCSPGVSPKTHTYTR